MKTLARPRTTAIATAAFVVFIAGSGAAQSSTEPAVERARDPRSIELARTLFDQAREAFARKSYSAAASAFEQSAAYVPHPSPWVNAAEAWILSGDPVRAAAACDRALAFPDIDAATRAQASERLDKVTPLVGTVEVTFAGPMSVRVDGLEARTLPTLLRLAPGAHSFEANNGSRSFSWTSNVRAGAIERRQLALQGDKLGFRDTRSTAGTDSETATTRSNVLRASKEEGETTKGSGAPPTISLVGFGVAAVAFGSATYFGVSALGDRDRWRDSGTADARSDFYRDRSLTNVSLGIGALVAVASTILWITDHRRPSK